MHGRVRAVVAFLGALAVTFVVLAALGIAGVFGSGGGGGGSIDRIVGGLIAPTQIQSSSAAHVFVSRGFSPKIECARGQIPPGTSFVWPGAPGGTFTCVDHGSAPRR
ncbi:MAG TPA: hypothetical protein VIE15_01145 [Acidimicrobiales bacterium]